MTVNTILLVDDEPYVLAALRRCLMDEDYVVRTAIHPAQAFEILASEPIDVVISDHDMPGVLGLTFLSEVRDQYPDIVRMMLSGKADLKLANEAVNAEIIYRFLGKPWQEEELRLMIRLALRHRDDRFRVRELSRLVREQGELFARVVERHPDCAELIGGYLAEQGGHDSANPRDREDDPELVGAGS
jgi:DNA-binding NtrC family response regulator